MRHVGKEGCLFEEPLNTIPVSKDCTYPNFQLFQKYIFSLADIILGEKKKAKRARERKSKAGRQT